MATLGPINIKPPSVKTKALALDRRRAIIWTNYDPAPMISLFQVSIFNHSSVNKESVYRIRPIRVGKYLLFNGEIELFVYLWMECGFK